MDDVEQFGRNLRQLRKEADLTQADLAYAAGVHRTYLGGIERGERNVSLKNILAIARALDVSPKRLFEQMGARGRP